MAEGALSCSWVGGGDLINTKSWTCQWAKEGKTKVLVIGSGRFGDAVAQGVNGAHVKNEDGFGIPCEAVQVSATKFMNSSAAEMAETMAGVPFLAYCGINLASYVEKLADAMRLCNEIGGPDSPTIEIVDFSNPDPITEKIDVPGAINLWAELTGRATCGRASTCGDGHKLDSPQWKIWKITDVGQIDVAGVAEKGSIPAKVYGNGIGPGEVPKLNLPGLYWEPAPLGKVDLLAEVRARIMQRAVVDRWYDGVLLGLAVFIFSCTYAMCRNNEKFNGAHPGSMIPMFVIDKAIAWTGLWMMVVSPFAGNLLALSAMCNKFGSLRVVDKLVVIISIPLMIAPILEFIIPFVFWILLRHVVSTRTSMTVYQGQDPDNEKRQVLKTLFIDMVSLKGETGVVGFVFVLVHSFIGIIVADNAYKKKWFNPDNKGRLFWNNEICLATGCLSTALLWVVTMRSLYGHASWITLKPIYVYVSPICIWLATVHVVSFGIGGWHKLFNGSRMLLSITFVSSMFPSATLLVNHLMAVAGSKTHINAHLWDHSAINLAKQDMLGFMKEAQKVKVRANAADQPHTHITRRQSAAIPEAAVLAVASTSI